MVVIKEVAVANGTAAIMMFFLLLCRRKNREVYLTEDRLYDAMVIINIFFAFFETVSFLVDGHKIFGGIVLNLLTNSLCFFGTVTIGFLWCLYTELRIYRNHKRARRNVKILMIPWILEVVAIICNLFFPGILFTVSKDNVYSRGIGSTLCYVSILIYFVYSTYLVYHSKNQGINLNFFPVMLFIGPCLIGVIVQFFFYGISTSCISVAVALTFIQTQIYAKNLYTDELSGLYNRRYLIGILSKNNHSKKTYLYGIMIDINDFKSINDNFGHGVGDRAICVIGNILFKSIPDNGIAIRYAGDEFIILLPDSTEEAVYSAIKEINDNLSAFNHSYTEPFSLSASMGYTKFSEADNAESFLDNMDKKMYEVKREYHRNKQFL